MIFYSDINELKLWSCDFRDKRFWLETSEYFSEKVGIMHLVAFMINFKFTCTFVFEVFVMAWKSELIYIFYDYMAGKFYGFVMFDGR